MNEVEECEICGKLLSRKQRLISHREKIHGIKPDHEAKKYKLYVSNSAVPIPRTTAFRKRKFDQETCIQSVTVSGQLDLECQEESTTFETRSETAESSSLSNLESCHSSSIHEEELAHTVSYNECTSSQNKLETGMLESIYVLNEHEVLNSNSVEIHVQNVYDKTMQSFPGAWECEAAAAELSDCDSSATSISRDSDSDIDTDFESDISSSSELDTDTEDNILSDDSSFDQPEIANSESQTKLTHDEEKDMALLSLLLRYHLGESGSRDVVKILNIFNPENKVKDPNKLKACIGSTETQIYEFCDKCYTLYTEEDIFQCAIAGCNGIRYKGPINKQQLIRKKTYFTCLPVKQQIKDILQREGIWSSIVKYRADCKATTDVTDIVTGEMYRDLCKPGQFMNGKDNFTLLFNTDGVPLFKSSGVSIWPIYLVINELPPVLRFSRRNMIIWGIWQSKGKPVFRTFLQPFIEHMIDLKDNGVSISVDGKTVLTRGLLLASTMDLQAKAYLTEMTQHNGKNSCITCEDPGEVVKQGRGHTRVYPHRNDSDLYKVRNSAEILACGLAALQTNKPEMGVKGVSSLHGLEWFDMVWGLVPDYMHGVLLGVTKMLMKLWFSSSHAGKPYFIGRAIKQIDKKLKKMKPTDDITRLPRKIENNMHHLKASELQMWLLFYSVPCLIDIMVSEYFNHHCLLVEGIYILLSDKITAVQLNHAEHILNLYYAQFGNLYGVNNCTINLHNTCRHLTSYVRKLGPLWAWSCFAFEDMNGTILESAHGTGDVCSQILWSMQARKRLTVDCSKMANSELRNFVVEAMNTRRAIKIKHVAENCKIAGGMKTEILEADILRQLRQVLNLPQPDDDSSLGTISKVGRIVKNDQVIFSKIYSRMTKRIGHVVLINNINTCTSDNSSQIASIQYFVLHRKSNKCAAIVKYITLKEEMALVHRSISHLITVNPEDLNAKNCVILVENIQEKLLYLDGNTKYPCIARLPNLYGQSS